MNDQEFRMMGPQAQLDYVETTTGDERNRLLSIIAQQRAERGEVAPPPVEDTSDFKKPKSGLSGGFVIAVGVVVIAVALFMPVSVRGGYLSGEVFNLEKGMTKLMTFFTGSTMVIVGTIMAVGNQIVAAVRD